MFLKLKQAKCALQDGHLEQAYVIVDNEALRSHRKGQLIIHELAEAFLVRATTHLSNKRVAQAHIDCSSAQKLVGNTSEISNLYNKIIAANVANADGVAKVIASENNARQLVADGYMTLGKAVAQKMPSGGGADRLCSDINDMHQRIKHLVHKVEEAINANDLVVGAKLLAHGNTLSEHQDYQSINRKYIAAVEAEVLSYITQGQIDHAKKWLNHIKGYITESHQLLIPTQWVSTAVAARHALSSGDIKKAAVNVNQLDRLLPEVAWVIEAKGAIQNATSHLDTVRAGPLGFIVDSLSSAEIKVANSEAGVENIGISNRIEIIDKKAVESLSLRDIKVATDMPEKLMVQIDGVGSYLIYRQNKLMIGGISSCKNVDLGFIGGPELQHVTIIRGEDDYLLQVEDQSTGGIEINGEGVKEKLLLHDDKIALSPRCRFKFQKQNVASSTAFLSFASAKFPRSDVRGAILLERELIIGSTTDAHIIATTLQHPVILYIADGHLLCRSNASLYGDGQLIDATTPLVVGVSYCTRDLSFVITGHP